MAEIDGSGRVLGAKVIGRDAARADKVGEGGEGEDGGCGEGEDGGWWDRERSAGRGRTRARGVPVSRGNQLAQSAQLRMMRRNERASTKERRMMAERGGSAPPWLLVTL